MLQRSQHRPLSSLVLLFSAAFATVACSDTPSTKVGADGGATGGTKGSGGSGPGGAGGAGSTSNAGGAGGTSNAGGAGGAAGSPSVDSGADSPPPSDLGASDASTCDEFVMPEDCTIPAGAVLPGDLRCTGLYSDWPNRTLRCGVKEFTPAYALWADGAGKQRYVWLPPGQTIDVSDPDNFIYPLGTRFWKEFYVGPEGSQRLGETRYLLKVQGGWMYTSYVWSEDGSAATQNNLGVDNLFGTGHSVPTREQCKTCHSGRPDYVLGWDFVMLGPGASGVTARQLAQNGQLAGLDPALLEVTVPGNRIEQAALGYLHANCGVSCHNQTPNAPGKPSGLFLRLESGALDSVFSTGAASSGINSPPKPNADYGDVTSPAGGFYDFRPMDPARSLSIARMGFRGSLTAMPPIGTHDVHPDGLAAVTAWVESMTVDRGYPAPAP